MNSSLDIEKLPEWKVVSRVRHFHSSHDIFEKNFEELLKALALYNSTPQVALELSSIGKRHQLHDLLGEINRRNHNFVASAKSLIDHSTTLYRQIFEPDNRFPDYSLKVKEEFAENPLTQFIIRFRQYCQHYKMPSISATTNFNRDKGISHNILIKCDGLLDFDGWNKAAKKYIKEQGESINLEAVVTDYHNHVNNFYKWYYARVEEILEPEQRVIEEYQIKARKEMTPMFINMIESSFKIAEQGIGSPLDSLHGFMADEELNELESLNSDINLWIDKAIEFIKSKFELPDSLEIKLRNYANEISKQQNNSNK